MSLTKMVDLELDDDEKLDTVEPIPVGDKPRYPWGTRVCLTNVELDKLGCKVTDFSVGDNVDLRCFAEVTSVSTSQTQDGEDCSRVELQICRMAVENEATEDEIDEGPERPSAQRRRRIYNHPRSEARRAR